MLSYCAVKVPCFHPFQGRPLFGPKTYKVHRFNPLQEFPSLSGKTSIRTDNTAKLMLEVYHVVSIPFREDLYSDHAQSSSTVLSLRKVSIPFREDLYSDSGCVLILDEWDKARFPSLSGKTSIRTICQNRCSGSGSNLFPSLSGKTSIRTRTRILAACERYGYRFHPFQGRPLFGLRVRVLNNCKTFGVSIPFREDLYSDWQPSQEDLEEARKSFHPFQGRPLFGHFRARILNAVRQYGFHPFQGRPLFGQVATQLEIPKQMAEFPSLSGKTSIRTIQNCQNYGFPI